MITKEQIKKFVTGDFSKVILEGNIVNDKINLNLQVEGISFDGVREIPDNIADFELENDHKKLFEYLFSYYLYNDISGVSYSNELDNDNKLCIKIFGSNNFDIILDKKIISILPDNFIDRLEKRKRESILENLKDMEFKSLNIYNFDCANTYLSLTGGNYDDYIIYNVLAKKDDDGNFYIPDEEIELSKKMIEIALEKDTIDYKYLNDVKNVIDLECSNNNDSDKEVLKKISEKLGLNYIYDLELKLNNSITLTIKDIKTLNIFREFLEEYLENKEKEKRK